MKIKATKDAKQSSVKRVMYLTRKLKLKVTNIINNRKTQMPIHKRNSRKSMWRSLKKRDFYLKTESNEFINILAHIF